MPNLAVMHPCESPESDLPDMMTMKMVGVSQVVPFPGKLAARRRAAEQQLLAARARLDGARLQIIREISHAYYELTYLERALQLVRAAHNVSREVERATQARYTTGTGEQRSVLDARVATARYNEQAIALEEERRIQRAALGAATGDSIPTDFVARIPERIARGALPASAAAVRSTSAEPGAWAAGSPLPNLRELQELAVRNNPELRARAAEIAALGYELELARKEYHRHAGQGRHGGHEHGRQSEYDAADAVAHADDGGRTG